MRKMGSKKKEQRLIKALKMVAPGTELREALEYIIKAGTGALIVIGDTTKVKSLCNGGFELNCAFRSQLLFELAKMDGAIILNDDVTRILKANVHLVPDSKIPTRETGIRHRTAERVAKQTKSIVIAISQRRDIVSLHIGDTKYALEDIRSILTKANQALQTLERYKSRLNEVSSHLSTLEFEGLVTLLDVVTVLQRSEMVQRVAKEIERYISELGTEGRLIEMQLEEMMAGVEEDSLMTIKDYCRERRAEEVAQALHGLPDEDLLDPIRECQVLGFEDKADLLEQPVYPRGFRLLKKIPRLPATVIDKLVERFEDLTILVGATLEELDAVEGVGEARAKSIHDGLKRLKEHSLVERAF